MDGVLIVNKPRLTGGHCAVRTLLQDFGKGIIRRQPQFISILNIGIISAGHNPNAGERGET